VSNRLEFAVIMAPANRDSRWYFGLSAEQVSQHLTQDKAMPGDISAYADTDDTVKFAVVPCGNRQPKRVGR
jgi:hypothetical protein